MIRFAGALKALGILVLLAVLAAAIGAGGGYLYLAPKLPSAETLGDVRLQVPLRVYTHEGELLAEFGEKRRTPRSASTRSRSASSRHFSRARTTASSSTPGSTGRA